MTHEQFIYWLEGFIHGKSNLDAVDLDSIKEYINKLKEEGKKPKIVYRGTDTKPNYYSEKAAEDIFPLRGQ